MMLSIEEIQALLPHRYPFLLVDRVVELEPGVRLVAIKNVTVNEPFFQGHFPGRPLMPGVLIVEAMAQCGAIIILNSLPDRDKKLAVFRSIDNAKFRRQVVPGDQLRIEVTVLGIRSRMGKMEAKAYIDGQLACQATLTCGIVSRSASEAEAAE